MCFKGDSVVHLKLIYLLHFKLFTYFKIILFWHFFVIVVFSCQLWFFCCFFWQSYQGISIAQIRTFHLSEIPATEMTMWGM